jgi:outer membrane autotransporter protein
MAVRKLAAILACTTSLATGSAAFAASVPCAPTLVNIDPADTMTCVGVNDLGPTGITSVQSGTLFINGTLTNDTTDIAAPAALGGSGTINSDVNVSGVLIASPGNLTVNGDLTFQSGSALSVTLGGGTSTNVAVSGNTVIFSGADVIITGDLTQDTTSTILTSGGLVHGSFDQVVDENGNEVFFEALSAPNEVGLMKIATVGVGQVITQAGIGVNLDAHRGMMNTIHARIDHRYRESARSGTPKRSGFDTIPLVSTNALMNSQIDGLSSSLWPSLVNGGLADNARLPEFAQQMITEDRSAAEKMRSTMSAVPRLQISTNYGGMWFEGFGVSAKQTELDNVTGYKSTSGGFSLGLDSHAADNWIFGGMIGYGVSDAELDHKAGGLDGDTIYTGIYMANISTTHFANLFLTAAVTNFEAERAVSDGLVNAIAEDDFGTYMWDARLELGRTFGFLDDDFIRPNVAFEYTSIFQDDYLDDGAGVVPGLLIEDQTTRMVRTEAQLDMLFGSQSFDDDGWSARIFLGVAHEIYLDNRQTNAFLQGFSNPITMTTGEDQRTFGMVGGSISFAVNQRLRTQISYQGEVNTEFERHNFVAGFSVAW